MSCHVMSRHVVSCSVLEIFFCYVILCCFMRGVCSRGMCVCAHVLVYHEIYNQSISQHTWTNKKSLWLSKERARWMCLACRWGGEGENQTKTEKSRLREKTSSAMWWHGGKWGSPQVDQHLLSRNPGPWLRDAPGMTPIRCKRTKMTVFSHRQGSRPNGILHQDQESLNLTQANARVSKSCSHNKRKSG